MASKVDAMQRRMWVGLLEASCFRVSHIHSMLRVWALAGSEDSGGLHTEEGRCTHLDELQWFSPDWIACDGLTVINCISYSACLQKLRSSSVDMMPRNIHQASLSGR